MSGRQDQDPVGVGGQAQLVARAEHPVADDAHLLGALDPPVAGQDRAGQCHGHALAGAMFVAPQTISSGSPVPERDRGQRQAVGARVLLDRQQLADDDVLPVAPQRSMPLTSIPSRVRRSASCSGVRSKST